MLITIPTKVKINASGGLTLRKAYNRGGTVVGIRTAKTLVRKTQLTIGQVKKIANYFPRHANDNLMDSTSNGFIAWLLWGGDEGWEWADKTVAKYERKIGKVKMETVK